MALEVKELYSGYRKIPVLKNINFHLNKGEICGLIGLNGAGKSTLLKTILGLLPPQSGSIRLNHMSIEDDHSAYASSIAYIPETPILYEDLTFKEHLEMTALGYKIPFDLVMSRAEPLIKKFRLDNKLHWFPAHFSKGMQQKVMIICAFVTQAELLIIDEPFLGLDPLAIEQLKQMMRDYVEEGKTILFTTHVLAVAEELCDKYLMLQAGEVIANGRLEDLQLQMKQPQATLSQLYIHMTELGEDSE